MCELCTLLPYIMWVSHQFILSNQSMVIDLAKKKYRVSMLTLWSTNILLSLANLIQALFKKKIALLVNWDKNIHVFFYSVKEVSFLDVLTCYNVFYNYPFIYRFEVLVENTLLHLTLIINNVSCCTSMPTLVVQITPLYKYFILFVSTITTWLSEVLLTILINFIYNKVYRLYRLPMWNQKWKISNKNK